MVSHLPFGLLRRPHGTKGEILLSPYNLAREQGLALTAPLAALLVRGPEVAQSEIVASRSVHAGFLVRFRERDTRTAVADIVGWEVHLPRAALAPPGDREFFIEDAVGCEAVGLDGTSLGQVTGAFWNGAQDVLAIVAADGSERLVPAVREFIHAFDPAERRVVVDLHE